MDQNQGVLVGLTAKSILVVQSKHGPDHVYVTTALPSPIPALTNQPLTFQFIAAAGEGPSYCTKFLGVDSVEVVKRS